MKSLGMVSMPIVLFLCVFANGQTVKVSEDPESLRQMLAHQPNYIATQSSGSEGRKHRLARLGNRLADCQRKE